MKRYSKKDVSKDSVRILHEQFGIGILEASILVRRGITAGRDLMYFLEGDLRFLHEPFLFQGMEDAVERIKAAVEDGEKILIFGDSDVDGVSATAILYGCLKDAGADVRWRLPTGDDAYGLSMSAVEDFAREFGTLIITVDCGIRNNAEIARAAELGVSVIVTDHHNPPEDLPCAEVIINPKVAQSGYPFQDISGAAVAFKLASALRFSQNGQFYAQEFCLMDVRPDEGGFRIDCLKTKNLVRTDFLSVKAVPGDASISETRLPEFLKGQALLVWNKRRVEGILQSIFGTGVEFNFKDMRPEIARMIPGAASIELEKIKALSKIARYSDGPVSEIEGFFNLFVTFVKWTDAALFPAREEEKLQDIQLVALSTLADIMPLKDENRIFVKNGIDAMNGAKARRKGLSELLSRTELCGRPLSSTDLSWKIVPILNAAGRMGRPDVPLSLLVSEESSERLELAEKIIAFNEERKSLVGSCEMRTAAQAKESYEKSGQKLCVVVDEGTSHGITGILAQRIMQKYASPAIAVMFSEDGSTAVGSMRSCRGCVATDFLCGFGADFFIDYGGHDCAAGFSFERGRLKAFLEKAEAAAGMMALSDEADGIDIDAEIPPEFITPALLQLVGKFEPFGEGCRELVFLSKSLKIQDARIVGKSERQHLKLLLDCKKHTVPAMFWGEADRLNKDLAVGASINAIYKVGKNIFNGMTSMQLIIIDAQPCQTCENQ